MRLRGSRRNNPRKLNAFTLCSVHAGRTVDERNLEQGDLQRLRPEMSSRRLLVLAFVRGYIGRWHGSPSIGEIAAGCGISRSHVRGLIAALVRTGLLTKRPGERGLGLPAHRPNPALPPPPALDYDPVATGGGSGGGSERHRDEAGPNP